MVESLDDLLTYTKAGGDPVLGIGEYLYNNGNYDWEDAREEAKKHAERFEKARRERTEWMISVAGKLMTAANMAYADAVTEAERLYRLEFKVDIRA